MKKELWIEIGYSVILATIILCGALLVENTNWDMVYKAWDFNEAFELPSGWSDAVINP